MSQKILIVDDDRTHCHMLGMLVLRKTGLKVAEVYNGQDCLSALRADSKKQIVLVILDLKLPGIGGMQVLQEIRRNHTDVPVIMLTGSQDMNDAIAATQAGAMDFMTKPVQGERLVVSINNALRIDALSQEVRRLRKQETKSDCFEDLIGAKDGLQRVIELGRKAAATNLPVLILGETGTGKEVFARAIHGESPRAGKAFITVNCGAIPEKLVESTLFGHEKGAFTGAVDQAAGKFREAQGGTLFLDEIGELSLEAQVKLLRVLQQGEVEPVGLARAVPVDVRIVAATNRNLEEDVRAGRFREDLYYRLNVIPVVLPPLRARMGDIADLTLHFMQRFAARENRPCLRIGNGLIERLSGHSWPGNVRELENTLYRAMALCDGDSLKAADIALLMSAAGAATGAESGIHVKLVDEQGVLRPFEDIEHDIIARAIAIAGGNMTAAANGLGVAKSTLYRKMN